MNSGFWISTGVYVIGTIAAAGYLWRAVARIKGKGGTEPVQRGQRPPSDSFEAPKSDDTGHNFPKIGAAHT